MDGFIGMFLDRLMATSLQTIALTGFAWLLCHFMPRLSPGTQCWLWWLVALQALAGLVVEPIRLPWLPVDGAPASAPLPLAGDAPAPGMPATASSLSTWHLAAFLAWSAGLLAMAAATTWDWRRVRGWLASSSSCPDAGTANLLAAACAAKGIRRVPELRISHHVTSPVLVGLVRPVLLLPARETLGAAELAMALDHELVHLRRSDLWWGCVPALARHIFFFHPCMHLAMREYMLAREAACDAAVVQERRFDRRDYGSLLLRLGTRRGVQGGLSVSSPTYRALSRRLAMLQNTSFLPRAGSLSILVVVAATGILPLRLVAAAAPAQQPEKVATTEAVAAAAADTEAAISFMPDIDAWYPRTSKAMGEQGVVRVRACYEESGRVTITEIAETSTHARLDRSALMYAKQLRIRPGIQDGRPVAGCMVVPVWFRLPAQEE